MSILKTAGALFVFSLSGIGLAGVCWTFCGYSMQRNMAKPINVDSKEIRSVSDDWNHPSHLVAFQDRDEIYIRTEIKPTHP